MGILGRKKLSPQSDTSSCGTQDLATLVSKDSTRFGSNRIVNMVMDVSAPIELVESPCDEPRKLSIMLYNATILEVRDMFRMLHAMTEKAKQDAFQLEDVTTFYQWFEGFFGILTSIFDTEEDVLYAWVEKAGAQKLETALGPRRRKTKKQRTKDLCWDIFDLKMQFEKKPDRGEGLLDLLKEICNESQQLATRVLTYFQSARDDLIDVFESCFTFDERNLIEASFMENLRATEQGKFVICALSRGFPEADQGESFLEESLRVGKSFRGTVVKQTRKYRKHHSDLVEKVATNGVSIQVSQIDDEE